MTYDINGNHCSKHVRPIAELVSFNLTVVYAQRHLVTDSRWLSVLVVGVVIGTVVIIMTAAAYTF